MKFKLKSAIIVPVTIFLCLAFSVFTGSFAQLNSGNLTQFKEKDGLPGARVNALLIDKLGYSWVGTINGLARYDGYEFKRYYFNPNDTASIHGLIVWSLHEDRRGKIWVATSPSFLNVFDPATRNFRQYDFSQLVNHPVTVEVNIRTMCEDNNGRMYFGVDTYYSDAVSSALLYKDENDDKIKKFPVPDSLDIQNVVRFAKAKNGTIFLLSYTGLFKINTKGKLEKIYSMQEEFKKNQDFPTDIGVDMDGHLWMVTELSKLYDVNLETGNYKLWLPDLTTASKEFGFLWNRICIDEEDNIWMGSNNGIRFFDRKTGKFSQFNTGIKKELEHTPVVDLALDRFGTLWIGSFKDGLIKYENRPQFKSYAYTKDEKNSLTSGWANIIYESSDGKIWIITGGSNNTAGISILDSRTGVIEPIPFSGITTRMNGLSAFWENAPGEFYLSAYIGLYAFSTFTHKIKPVILPGLPDTAWITFHLKDSRENEWVCTFRGLYKKDKEAPFYRKYDLSQFKGSNASSNEITAVYESNKHGLWILTNNGLFLYNYPTDKIQRYGYDKKDGDIFVTQDINSFYEDGNGIVWAGTWQGGLSRYDFETKKIKTFTINDGLPSMSIQAIIADEKNNTLWLSTFDGLSRLNLKTEQFNNFSLEDGIQNQLFADGSCLKTSTGLFVFGGSNGVTVFNPDDFTKKSIPPKVFLTDFKLFNQSMIPGEQTILQKPIYETEQITLNHNQNNISIDFIALHYSNPSKNRYTHKLENYDNEWRNVGNLHEAFYPNLPPGKYVFRVKASNNNGVWNEEGATLKIIVQPPWWKTTWAFIIYGLLFVASAFAIDRYFRGRIIQKEKERSRARELEQAKEIEKAYYKLGEAHEALKSTQTQLVQSEKMASLGELTAGIAHEIQNPLNFVNNFSEVNTELLQEMKQELDTGNLTEAKKMADDVIENEKKINHHGKRADAIVKGMLQHSKSSSGVKEATDINALCDEYVRLTYHGLRAKDKSFNAVTKTDFDNSIGKINIIPQEIGRVILNLLTNAFYEVNEKKQMRITGYEPTVSVSTKQLNDKVEIRVSDNGNGIPQKVLDKIFQPFFTTKPTGQGTGLGLSLSYDIITKGHGGELKAETKEGEGSTFIIQLPVV